MADLARQGIAGTEGRSEATTGGLGGTPPNEWKARKGYEKSIAIRKVFGGTLESETRRNLNEYVIMILIANVIAIPLAVWLCGRYLEDFVYRIDLHPWIFVVTVLLSFVIAIGPVLWQTLRVAKTNPAEALKKE